MKWPVRDRKTPAKYQIETNNDSESLIEDSETEYKEECSSKDSEYSDSTHCFVYKREDAPRKYV